MSVQTPHATFAQQRPDTAAPFLYKSQGLPIHVPVVTKSGTISVRPDQVLNLDHVETDMIVNPQTSPPSGFLNANGTRFQFQLLPSNYCVVHSYMELVPGSNSNYCHPIIALFTHTWNLTLVTQLPRLFN